MLAQMKPEGGVEYDLAERVVVTSWRLRRLPDAERVIYQ